MRHNSKVLTALTSFLTIALLLTTTAFSQEGDPEALEVLEKWKENYEESIEGIDDYVMEKEDHIIYYKKAYDNGRPYFKSRIKNKNTQETKSAPGITDADLFSELYSDVKEKAVYKGTDEIDGHKVHVLYIEELRGILDDENPQTYKDVYLRIDPEKWVLREAQSRGDFEYQGETRQVDQVMQNREFRNFKGMQIPYETVTIIRGLALTEEERKEARETLDKIDQKMENMPESQRKMAEQMMGSKVEKYRNMLEKDTFEKVSRVQEVRVNTGLEFDE